MTTFNTDYNNTELLDQELTIEQLEAVAGGGMGSQPKQKGIEPKDVLTVVKIFWPWGHILWD